MPLGACSFDLARGLLLRDGAAVPLRPKAFALLSHLARNAGRVVGKSELIEAVWPGVFVTEDSLTQAVREVRKALADDAQKIVRTIARRGYLLITPATAAGPHPDPQPTVAVLRFANTRRAEDAPLVDGFAEDIAGGLARFRRVAVVAHNTSFAIADGAADWREAVRRLACDYLVRGRAAFASGTLTASVSLLDAASGAMLWSADYEASGERVFDVQQEIMLKIINRLAARIDDATLARAMAKPTASLEAYELLLHGLARFRGYGSEDNDVARELFTRALETDPGYGLAHAYLALVDLAIGGYGEAPAELVAATVDRASHAVTLAPEEPRCHRVLAMTRLHAREHEAAEYHMRRALDLNPCDADTMAQMGYLMTMRGRPFEALAWLDRAVAVNPVHPDWYLYDRATALYAAGDYQGAVDALSKLLIRTPWRLTRLAACHAQLGDGGAARRLMAEIARNWPDYEPLSFGRCGIAFEHAAEVEHMLEGIGKALEA